jgi:large exoprotein involved in heme utilization and adhesion
LDDAKINVDTVSGQFGSLKIDSSNVQLLRGSKITTNAGSNSSGGNININTDTLVLLEGSSITANAVFGNGGNITIDTQGLFQSPDSAIAASSEFGIDGTVSIDTPGTALITNELNNPTEVPQITIACNPNNSYTVVGSGGLPPDLDAPIDSPMMAESPPQANESAPTTAQPVQLVEAQGWRENNDGTVDFTVDAAGVLPYGTLATPTCRDTASTGASSVGR